jgi:hypothetical protein
MNKAYVEFLSCEVYLVEVQVYDEKINRVVAHFHEFKTDQELEEFKQKNQELEFTYL